MEKFELLEAVLEQLEFSGEERSPRKGITFWVTEDEHKIYSDLQARSKRKFGKSFEKLLKQVLRKKAA